MKFCGQFVPQSLNIRLMDACVRARASLSECVCERALVSLFPWICKSLNRGLSLGNATSPRVVMPSSPVQFYRDSLPQHSQAFGGAIELRGS